MSQSQYVTVEQFIDYLKTWVPPGALVRVSHFSEGQSDMLELPRDVSIDVAHDSYLKEYGITPGTPIVDIQLL